MLLGKGVMVNRTCNAPWRNKANSLPAELSPGPIAQNKPNSCRQGPSARNKANSHRCRAGRGHRGMGRGGNRAKQSQSAPVPGGWKMRNKPNSMGYRAKQSQSAPGEEAWWGKWDPKRDLPRLGARSTLRADFAAPNKPNSARPPLGRNGQNEPNLGESPGGQDHRQAPRTPLAAATRRYHLVASASCRWFMGWKRTSDAESCVGDPSHATAAGVFLAACAWRGSNYNGGWTDWRIPLVMRYDRAV